MIRKPLAALHAVLRPTPEELQLSKLDPTKARTHIDPTLPADLVGAASHSTFEQLMQLKKDQLLCRAEGMRGVSINTNLSKKELAQILSQREAPEQEDEGAGVKRQRRGLMLEQYQSQLRGDAKLTSFWVDQYGDIDQLNRALY